MILTKIQAVTKLPLASANAQRMLRDITSIREEMVAAPAVSQHLLDRVHTTFRNSASNLLHYLALRRHDLRPVQRQLAMLGLSSLGRAESHVLATIDSVLGVLHLITDSARKESSQKAAFINFDDGRRLLEENTVALLGLTPTARQTRIMVTMPSEAAEDDGLLIHKLLEKGMDCMRINCAHDSAEIWQRMIDHLRRSEQALGRTCKVVMDLAGPKLRTGPLEPGPAVLRVRPIRNALGQVVTPARVWLTTETSSRSAPVPTSACLQLPAKWVARLQTGDRLKFVDARDAKRSFQVVEICSEGCWLELAKTAYIVPTTCLHHLPRSGKGKGHKAAVGDVLPKPNALALKQGDLLILTRDVKPGHPAIYDGAGQILNPAQIGCTIPEVLDAVKPGESIWFDDGKIGGQIEKVESNGVFIRITQVRLTGEKLRSDKGINLPESNFHLSAMTAKDVEDLSFVAHHADIVELSFANTVADVESLQHHLGLLTKNPPAIVLKIETRRGFENLPSMLLAAMRMPACGVMIARGDLAVECGFERMAEVQEEILWICEAAHVPVIWATQILDTLAREGMPSRAEITDAGVGNRAECVMLNKGPHVDGALTVLDDILRRMQTHQSKKQSMMRELHLAHVKSAQ